MCGRLKRWTLILDSAIKPTVRMWSRCSKVRYRSVQHLWMVCVNLIHFLFRFFGTFIRKIYPKVMELTFQAFLS